MPSAGINACPLPKASVKSISRVQITGLFGKYDF